MGRKKRLEPLDRLPSIELKCICRVIVGHSYRKAYNKVGNPVNDLFYKWIVDCLAPFGKPGAKNTIVPFLKFMVKLHKVIGRVRQVCHHQRNTISSESLKTISNRIAEAVRRLVVVINNRIDLLMKFLKQFFSPVPGIVVDH